MAHKGMGPAQTARVPMIAIPNENYLPSMASARLLSQSPCTSSILPASHAAAMAGSMGSLAVLGMPCLAAMASMWLSPKMACYLPQSGQV